MYTQNLKAAGGGQHLKNAARDLRRRFLTENPNWPELYYAEIAYGEDSVQLPFYLPHAYASSQVMMQEEWAMEPGSRLCTWVQSQLDQQGIPDRAEQLLALNLWGDGVPFSKKNSLFQVARQKSCNAWKMFFLPHASPPKKLETHIPLFLVCL